jgi:hypothetical protein
LDRRFPVKNGAFHYVFDKFNSCVFKPGFRSFLQGIATSDYIIAPEVFYDVRVMQLATRTSF